MNQKRKNQQNKTALNLLQLRLTSLFSLTALAILINLQDSYAQVCCLTNTLIINTGRDPATGAMIPPVAAGASDVGHRDTRWRVSFNSPSMYMPGTTASGAGPLTLVPLNMYTDVVNALGGYTDPAARAISCLNADFYATDGFGASMGGIYPDGASRQYYTDFYRDVFVCLPPGVATTDLTYNFCGACDNGFDVYFDQWAPPPFAPGAPPSLFYMDPVGGFTFSWTACTPVGFTATVGPGWHRLLIRGYQFNHTGFWSMNNFFLTVNGTVTSSVPNSLVSESAACAGWAFCTQPPILGPASLCIGATGIYTNAAPGGTWSWTPSPSFAATVVGADLHLTAISFPGTITLTYTDPCGREVEHTVTVNPIAVATIAATGSPCDYSPVGGTLTFTGTPGATIHFLPAATSGVTFVTIPMSGMPVTIPASPGTYTITTVVPPPGFCAPAGPFGSATITAITMPPVTCYSYEDMTGPTLGMWHLGFNNLSGLPGITVTFSADVMEMFSWLVGTGTPGVPGSVTSPFYTTGLTPIPVANEVHLYDLDPLATCFGTGNLCASLLDYNPSAPVYSPPSGYIYNVYLTSVSYSGCTWPTSCRGMLSRPGGNGVASHSADSQPLSVIPNPNKGAFTIGGSLPNTTAEFATIEVVNLLGQSVLSEVAAVENSVIAKNITLDDGIVNGLYFVKIKAGNEHWTLRFTLDR